MIDNGYRFKFNKEYFGNEVICETRILIDKFWTEEREQAICDWLNNMSRLHGINPPGFKFLDSEEGYVITGGGTHIPDLNLIILFKKYSLVTLLHEYRHYLQHSLIMTTMTAEEKEEDARAWSTSLYYVCDKERFEKAMNKEIIHFV